MTPTAIVVVFLPALTLLMLLYIDDVWNGLLGIAAALTPRRWRR